MICGWTLLRLYLVANETSKKGTTNTHVVNRFSLTEVHKPDHANVDIVFVHGLNGHPQQTWTSEKSHIFWPADLLPPILEDEKARILVYGYDADVISFTDGASKDRIHNHAESLVATLTGNRRVAFPLAHQKAGGQG